MEPIRVAVAFCLLLLASSNALAQGVTPRSNLLQQLQTLQAELREHQKTLADFDFETLRLDAAWLDRLNMDRSSCIETMNGANNIISNLVSDQPPKFLREVLLIRVLERTESCLFKVHDFLNLAGFEVHPTQQEIKSLSGAARSLAWQGQIGSWVNELHPQALEDDVLRRAAELDR